MPTTANKITPLHPTHPGEVIKEEIEYRGISQRKLAMQIGISYSMFNEILNGKRPVNIELALLLEAALDIEPETLINMQSRYNMLTAKQDKTAVLFDMDGVVLDTESQYSVFWDKAGRDALGIEHFDSLIKGTTNTQIGEDYFRGREEEFAQIIEANRAWEAKMTYNYFPGVVDFINDLRANGVKLALVTSSDEAKMACVYRARPEIKDMFDIILSSGSFTRSKPDPECFLLAMKQLDVTPGNSFVMEDSFHGLTAGRASGATVIGMATTNSREAIQGKADYVLDSFQGMTYKKLISLF